MRAFVIVVLLLLLSATDKGVAGEGCSTVTTSGRPVVNMCESGNWTLGIVYIAVNTTSMGTSTSCSCTMSGTAQGQDITTTFTLEHNIPTLQDCVQTVIKIDSSRASQEVKCGTGKPSYIFPATENIAMILERPSSMFVTSLCLSVIPNSHAANNIFLTCEGLTTTTEVPTTPGTSSVMPSVMTSTSSSLSSPSNAATTSAGSPASAMTSTAESTVTSRTDKSSLGNDRNQIGPIVGGVVGGVAVLVIVVVVVVVCIRKKKHSKPHSEGRSGTENRGYENVLTDNILYESSSGPPNNQSPPSSQPAMSNGEGAYQSLDENGKGPSVSYYNTSGGLATVSTSSEREAPIFGANDYATVDEVTPRPGVAEPKRTSASPPAASPAPPPAPPAAAAASPAAVSAPPVPAPKPPSDQYAVVTKPPRQNKPAQSADARSQSSNVTLPSGDVYAVVDRTRARGSEPTSPRYPPPQVAPPPSPAPDTTPGLVYADLELAPSPRSSARMSVPSTDYAEIDHEASARL